MRSLPIATATRTRRSAASFVAATTRPRITTAFGSAAGLCGAAEAAAPSSTRSARVPRTLRQLQRLAELAGGQPFDVNRRAGVELPRAGKAAHEHRIEPGIDDQLGGDVDGRLVVAGNRDPQLLALPMRFTLDLGEAEGIQRAHQAHARQVFRGSDTGAPLQRVGPDLSVAIHARVADVDDDLALHERGVVAADVRQLAIRHGDQNHIAELRGFRRRAGARLRARLGHEILQVAGVARREENLMARLRPLQSDGAALPARADDADLHRLRRRRLRAQTAVRRQRHDECGEKELPARMCLSDHGASPSAFARGFGGTSFTAYPIRLSHSASMPGNSLANVSSARSPAGDNEVRRYVIVAAAAAGLAGDSCTDTVPILDSGVTRTYSIAPAERSIRATSQSVSSPPWCVRNSVPAASAPSGG